MQKRFKGLGVWVAMLVVAYLIYMFAVGFGASQTKMVYSDLVNSIKSEQVSSMLVSGNTVTVTLTNGDKAKVKIPSLDTLQADVGKEMNDQMDKGTLKQEAYETKISWTAVTNIILIIVFICVFFFGFLRKGGSGATNFTKSRARLNENTKNVTFKDVAGADEEKAELAEIVEFLKNPQKFVSLGARIPKGVLLVGSPGTGKTLLAKAVAGEAKVPFFSISGSDFVELYVGVGASRVRDLFEQAKKNRPCIVFIDEIDAVGRKRGAGMGGGHDEREQTLNQLLVEMDGFGENQGVIVIAATNRPDILDPALLRPGRFDRQVTVSYPDIDGREAILKVHAKRKPLGPDVDLRSIASQTVGFTGADLENLLNEAALLAARRKKKAITMPDIEEAAMKVLVGTEKKSHRMTERDKKITAYHEAGHAVTSYYLEHKDPVTHISIVPRGMAGGFTMYQPEKDEMHLMKSRMLDDIVGLLGGRVAEKIIFNDISTGASNDIERASDTARKMITKYGMSEKLGPITFGTGNDEVFLGKDYNHMRNYSEAVACEIDEEVEKIILKAYDRTESILNEHIDKLHAVAKALVEREKIDAEQFKILMEGGTLPPYEPKSEKVENKTETVEKDKPSAADDKNADEAVKDLEDNFNNEKKYLTKDVASEAEKEVDSDEKKNSSDETGKEN